MSFFERAPGFSPDEARWFQAGEQQKPEEGEKAYEMKQPNTPLQSEIEVPPRIHLATPRKAEEKPVMTEAQTDQAIAEGDQGIADWFKDGREGRVSESLDAASEEESEERKAA